MTFGFKALAVHTAMFTAGLLNGKGHPWWGFLFAVIAGALLGYFFNERK
jgi:ABC-type uncharacterized transport system permease subunit